MMYLLSDRFLVAVAFVEGFNLASGGRSLEGFQQWVGEKLTGGYTNRYWPWLIASIHVPEILNGGISLEQIPREYDKLLIESMIDLLEEFLGQ
ncbi:hypothetical protein ACOALZ_00545 [Nocardiopsis algeriensis]|uniref:hypothetical protein n=1 Tax=Nocardiopsis algeriensis TaxID=1478215 RepID=UPI003B43492A